MYIHECMYAFTYFWIHMCNIKYVLVAVTRDSIQHPRCLTKLIQEGPWQFFAKTFESKRHRESSSQIDLDIKKWNHQLESLESPSIKSETINFWILLVKPLSFFFWLETTSFHGVFVGCSSPRNLDIGRKIAMHNVHGKSAWCRRM